MASRTLVSESGSSATTLKTDPDGGAAPISHATVCLELLTNSAPPSPTVGPLLKSAHGVKTTSSDLLSAESSTPNEPPASALVKRGGVHASILPAANPWTVPDSWSATCQR